MQYEEDEDIDEEGDEDGEYGIEEMDPYDSRLQGNELANDLGNELNNELL